MMRNAAIIEGVGVPITSTSHYLILPIPLYALTPLETCTFRDIDHELKEEQLRFLARCAMRSHKT